MENLRTPCPRCGVSIVVAIDLSWLGRFEFVLAREFIQRRLGMLIPREFTLEAVKTTLRALRDSHSFVRCLEESPRNFLVYSADVQGDGNFVNVMRYAVLSSSAVEFNYGDSPYLRSAAIDRVEAWGFRGLTKFGYRSFSWDKLKFARIDDWRESAGDRTLRFTLTGEQCCLPPRQERRDFRQMLSVLWQY